MLKINRAIISVWDKHGLVEFAKKLKDFGVEILSTGKTASILKTAGIEAQEISEYTGFPEILNGRVKTLHATIYAGVLAKKGSLLHGEQLLKLKIPYIDMVVVNFYPFESMLKENLTFEEMLEYIDIGGPCLLRAAAKNFRSVAAVSSPSQYAQILSQMKKNGGKIGEDILQNFAKDAFLRTKQYDSTIYSFFAGKEVLSFDFEKQQNLRYGENSHQGASLYTLSGRDAPLAYEQLQGKVLSYNNMVDISCALKIVQGFSEPAAAVIKHASPCGVSSSANISKAYINAYTVDALSSFGGVVGLNRKVDTKTAKDIIKSGFKECVCAPGYSKEALKIFSQKKNMMVLAVDLKKDLYGSGIEIKQTAFGYLMQEPDAVSFDKNALRVVTKKRPTDRQMEDLLFSFKVVKYVKSNAIVIGKGKTTAGIGAGQPSRVGSVKIALNMAGSSARGAVLASDGFFPKEDSITLAKKAGIAAIIQPGGSVKDPEVIRMCDKYGIPMVFTGVRHFFH